MEAVAADVAPGELVPVEVMTAEEQALEAVLVLPAPAPAAGGEASSRPMRPEEILGALRGEIAPVTTTASYKLGVALATLVMLLLPVLYVVLIGLIISVVGWHLSSNWRIITVARNGRAAGMALVLYLIPACMGAVMIFFMIKPFFARPSGRSQKRYLTPESEPLLFAFVERICAAVRAPFPRRIDVDCDVNASASFRRGLWSVFSGSDLVLTIGLPFVAGLTMHQFAGVLAHELGHFSQGAGMRLSYVIRVISMWFTRAVYERDSWDDWLQEATSNAGPRLSWIGYLARFCVWCTRRILWLFMLAGHAAAGYLMRQMEFDADRFEARLAGSDTFELTCRRMGQLNVAYQAALSDLRVWYREGRLGDDLPMIMASRVEEMPADLKHMIDQSIDEGETGLFDSHPCDRDRIASARREAAPGVFRLARPAAELFAGYSLLCRLVTEDMYRAILGDEFNPQEMHPSADLLVRRQRQKADEESLERLTLNCFHILRPIPLPALLPDHVAAPRQLVADIKVARERLLSLREAYRRWFHQFDDADTVVFESTAAIALYRAHVSIPHDAFKFPVAQREHVDQAIHQARNAMVTFANEMLPFESLVAARLERGLLLLTHPQIAARLPDAPRWLQEARRFLPIIQTVNAANDQLQEVRNCRAAMGRLCEQLENNRENEALIQGILAGNRWLTGQVNEYRRMLENVEYPFDHARGPIPLSEHLAPMLVDPEDIGATYDATGQLLERVIALYVRLLGRLASYTEQVERVLGLPPLEYPRDNGIEDRGTP